MICPKCNKNKCESKGVGKGLRLTCNKCRRKGVTAVGAKDRRKRKWRAESLAALSQGGPLKCTSCPFVAVDPCQMDINHKDGNRNNNDLSNLEMQCACCHRLITKQQGHYKNKY